MVTSNLVDLVGIYLFFQHMVCGHLKSCRTCSDFFYSSSIWYVVTSNLVELVGIYLASNIWYVVTSNLVELGGIYVFFQHMVCGHLKSCRTCRDLFVLSAGVYNIVDIRAQAKREYLMIIFLISH